MSKDLNKTLAIIAAAIAIVTPTASVLTNYAILGQQVKQNTTDIAEQKKAIDEQKKALDDHIAAANKATLEYDRRMTHVEDATQHIKETVDKVADKLGVIR